MMPSDWRTQQVRVVVRTADVQRLRLRVELLPVPVAHCTAQCTLNSPLSLSLSLSLAPNTHQDRPSAQRGIYLVAALPSCINDYYRICLFFFLFYSLHKFLYQIKPDKLILKKNLKFKSINRPNFSNR